jgi:hypothetical protein
MSFARPIANKKTGCVALGSLYIEYNGWRAKLRARLSRKKRRGGSFFSCILRLKMRIKSQGRAGCQPE